MLNRVCRLGLAVGLLLAASPRAAARGQAPEEGLQRATLYASVGVHHTLIGRSHVSFKTGKVGDPVSDLIYGALRVGDEWDWFNLSGRPHERSVALDLGAHRWTDEFLVPVVEPLPPLKPGERRHRKLDASGADGADGAPGLPGLPGRDGDGVLRGDPLPARDIPARDVSRPKIKVKADPFWFRAKPGHMYVMRVVDNDNDFYVLFRVEELVRGERCTISWKRIPPPQRARTKNENF